ncbi:MAG: hypothetical protein HYT69_00035 [Candidatus Zambryskibacteria bacterium]|nr:hypothetical protein [Candidatus Zambryskibacteria bacterium]
MALIFTPKIIRYANLYFFIQNLSEWHFSNRKSHNETWRNELHFSAEAESCLDEFKKIHQQYSFGDKYLGRPFFLYKDPWPTVELLVGKNDSAKIKNIFATLESYFNTIYVKDEVMLKKWGTIIAKPEFVTSAYYINNTLANFYGCAPYNENCIIYLLLSTEKRNGGTAGTISDNAVTLELSRTSIKLEEHMFNVLWHELIHLYFRNCLFYPLLEKCTGSNRNAMGKIDELVASSLLPNGLLKHNTLSSVEESGTPGYFNARINSEKKIINVQKLIYPYLQQKKTLDINLVQKLYKIELGGK